MPIHSYKKGYIYLHEKQCIEALTKGNVNIDDQFHICFTNPTDSRDGTPLTYPGRLVVPSHVNVKDSTWRSTPLMKRTTSDLPQLPARDMRKVEDVSANALPSSNDDVTYVQGAHKFEQLGQQCMGMIFDAMFTDISVQNRLAILIVDFRTTVGDGLLAFSDKRRSYNMPMY